MPAHQRIVAAAPDVLLIGGRLCRACSGTGRAWEVVPVASAVPGSGVGREEPNPTFL